MTHFDAVRSLSSWLMIAITTLAGAVALALGYLLVRAIRRPLLQVQQVAEAIAEGDLERSVDLHGTDEIGRMAGAFARALEYMRHLARAAARVADGDLTTTIEPASERDTLGTAFATLAANMRSMVGEIHDASSSFSTTSQQMAANSDEAGRAVDEITGAVSIVAEGAERQVKMVDVARRSAEQTASQAGEARTAAREGVDAAHDATTAMAAVAEEVRTLAEESQQAAASIAQLIEQIQIGTHRTVQVVEEGARRSDEGVDVVASAREAFERIGTQVENVTNGVAEILEATNQVASVAEETSASSQQVSASTHQTSVSAQHIAASAQELAKTADQLLAAVGRFTL